MEDERMTPIPQLRRVRLDQALTQRDLAAQAGVTQTTIVKAEQGAPVRLSTQRKLARALGVHPRELVNGEGGS
jgi:DNA-binding XRE family transcriptional regulator